jgi:hypothetical protein
MEKDTADLNNPLLDVHAINDDDCSVDTKDNHHHTGHEGHVRLEDIVLPPLNED